VFPDDVHARTLDAVLARYHGNQRGVKAKKATPVLISQSVMSEKKFQEVFPSHSALGSIVKSTQSVSASFDPSIPWGFPL
jgi:hypothetical protein